MFLLLLDLFPQELMLYGAIQARLDPEPQMQKARGRKRKYGKQIKVNTLLDIRT
jgi:hypothetical protein